MYNFDFFMCFFSGNEDNVEPIDVDDGYEALVPVASGSRTNAPENKAPPPEYAAVDKENRQGNTVCKGLKRQ